MIVIDVNVLAYSLIQGDKTVAAREVGRRDPNWRLPPLWRQEFQNVLTTHVRAERLSLEQAVSLLNQADAELKGSEVEPDSASVLRTAIQMRISAYDANYLTLAEELGVWCVSEDKRLRQAAPERVRAMEEFLSQDAGQ